jgi:hypothetical protein
MTNCAKSQAAAVFAFAAYIAGPDLFAQQPVFRSDVDLVAVNVAVTDIHGRSVRNLSRDAFQITEDDRPQTIVQFSSDPVSPSVVLALDTSSSMRGGRFGYARNAVWRFIDSLTPGDEISVYGFNDRPYVISPWTSGRGPWLRLQGSRTSRILSLATGAAGATMIGRIMTKEDQDRM